MDPVIVVALISGWVTIIGGIIELRFRTNGSGPVAKKIDSLQEDVSDFRSELRDVKADVRCIKRDFSEHLRTTKEKA